MVFSIESTGAVKEISPAAHLIKFCSASTQIRGSLFSTAKKPNNSFCQIIGAANKLRACSCCNNLVVE